MPSAVRPLRISLAGRVLLLALAVLGAWFVLVTAAAAQTASVRYVAAGGVDTGNCTDPDDPCASLNYAVQQVDDGDEVRLAEGVYADPEPLVPAIIEANRLTIVGEGDVAFLDDLLILNADAVTVRGIDLVGGTIVVAYSTDVVLDDISVTSPPPGAIGVWGIASEVAVLNSAFSGDFAEAVRLQADVGGELNYAGGGFDAVVRNVTVAGGGVGIQVAAMSAATVDNVTVTGAETAIEVGSLFFGEIATIGLPAAPFSAQITNSYFEGSTSAMTIYGEAPGGLDIHSNQILGPVRLISETPEEIAIDLEENWWGSATGPQPSTFVNDGDATYDLDFTPWCADAACSTLLPANPPPVDPPPVDPPPVGPPPVGPPPVDPPPVDPPPVDPPASEGDELPPLPRYYEVPAVVSVTIEADGETEELSPRTKDEWLEEARRLLPQLRKQDWFPDVVITVVSGPGEDPGAIRIKLPTGVSLDEVGR